MTVCVLYGGREGSAASRVKKPKRQSKADVGNSKIEAAIENQERILEILVRHFKISPACKLITARKALAAFNEHAAVPFNSTCSVVHRIAIRS